VPHCRLSSKAIVAELHLQLFSNIFGSDRIVVKSLTFRGHVTSLLDHMTDLYSPIDHFIGGPLERSL